MVCPPMSDEAALLLATLVKQRRHVLGILDGLSDEVLGLYRREIELANAIRELIDGRTWLRPT